MNRMRFWKANSILLWAVSCLEFIFRGKWGNSQQGVLWWKKSPWGTARQAQNSDASWAKPPLIHPQSIGGIMVNIVAFQAVDLGLIPSQCKLCLVPPYLTASAIYALCNVLPLVSCVMPKHMCQTKEWRIGLLAGAVLKNCRNKGIYFDILPANNLLASHLSGRQ